MKTKSCLPRIASHARMRRIVFVFTLVSALWLNESYAQRATLLADVTVSEDVIYNEYSSLTNANGKFYFIGHGSELWTTHPENPDDLVLVKRFLSISNLTVVGNNLFFVADDGGTGSELWKSNGTATGTVLVKDIRVGVAGSSPGHLTNVRGVLYFSAHDGVNGRELWRSNGIGKGTVLVKDILRKWGSSNPTSLAEVNGSVFFAANDGVHGIELWKSNGTADGTVMVKDIRPDPRINSSPSELVNVYGMLFFVAKDATSGRELWKSNGTAAGTIKVKDILPGPSDSQIKNGTALYRTLFFSATDGVHGQELWKSDGTEAGTVMVKDLTPGPAGSTGVPPRYEIGNFKKFFSTLFFTAYQNETYYIWKSDGTPKGTIPLVIARGPRLMQPRPQFTYFNNRIYYFNRHQEEWENEFSLNSFWSMDRNGNDHERIADFETYSPTYPGIALVGSFFYLTGSPPEIMASGVRMMRSWGIPGGTFVLDEDIGTKTRGSYPQEFNLYNGRVFFRADHSYYQQHELWVTDGTPEGTTFFSDFWEEVDQLELVGSTLFASIFQSFALVKTNLNTGEGDYLLPSDFPKPIIKFMTQANGLLYFSNGDGGELWKSDGTRNGTTQLKAFHRVIALDAVGSRIMFRIMLENGTEELWRSNGTAAGTVKIKTLRTGGNTVVAGPSAVVGSTYYFVSNDGIHGREVWKSTGTATGTQMVVDLNTNDVGDADDIRHLFVYKGELLISAMGQDGKWGLYKTNGTASGTQLIQHIGPIVNSVVTSDKIYLFALDSDRAGSASSLWITDGSADGTQPVKKLTSAFGRLSHALIDDIVYFSINESGPLWRTDGTECGTFTLDIGSKGASPMIALNNTLIFGSEDSQAGYEPHALSTAEVPGNPCDTIHVNNETQSENISSGYPNPFTNDFALRIKGRETERAVVKVFTLYGKPVEDVGELVPNADHRIGQSWAPGIYIIHVAKGGQMTRLMVVKE